MSDNPTARSTAPQLLLGVFIVWQLAFMLLANGTFLLQSLLPSPKPEESSATSFTRGTVQRTQELTTAWGRLTLQRQEWGMFSHFPEQSAFPAVRLVWNDGTAVLLLNQQKDVPTLLSPFEPAYPDHFFAPNIFADRMYNFEAWLVQIYQAPHEANLLRNYWQPMHAYMCWRLVWFQQFAPGSNPDEVILMFRSYTTPPPNQQSKEWSGPHSEEFVRWRPAREAADELPLEMYDRQTRRYVGVKAAP
jgi:hypothetical protein